MKWMRKQPENYAQKLKTCPTAMMLVCVKLSMDKYGGGSGESAYESSNARHMDSNIVHLSSYYSFMLLFIYYFL